ncbi:MAG: YlbF family regulator [Gemmatimonadaceae bacterium]
MLDQRSRDLGRLIGQSSEYQSVKRANEALHNDRDAVAAITRMEELRQSAQRLLARGEEPSEDMELELDQLLNQVQGNPVYQTAISAQANFDKLMLQVNGWIAEGIKSGVASPIITLG